MSKERARRRADRERQAATAHERNAAERQRVTARRDRARKRSTTWRSLRLWHGSGGRPREQWAVAAAVGLMIAIGVWFATRSVGVVVFVVLVALVVGPAVLVLSSPTRSRTHRRGRP